MLLPSVHTGVAFGMDPRREAVVGVGFGGMRVASLVIGFGGDILR